MRLESGRIVEVGLKLLDRDGFEALSLAKIAAALGVQTPALYWHIRNRDELYGLMAEAMLHECLEGLGQPADARAWLTAFGRGLRALHLRIRDGAKLAAMATPTAATRDVLIERIVEELKARGLDREQAMEAQSAVQSFVLGWSLFLSNPPVAKLISRSMDADAAFETGLRALAEGFCDARRARPRLAPAKPRGARKAKS